MLDTVLSRFFKKFSRSTRTMVGPLQGALTLGCVALSLAGCGGGSGSPEPANPPISNGPAAPQNFVVDLGEDIRPDKIYERFFWDATQGAASYELFVDPDGPGPLPEVKMATYSEGASSYFTYIPNSGNQATLMGYVVDANAIPARINATYRLRACNADGCGAFTPSKALDITRIVSHEFPSARVAFKESWNDRFRNAALSQDGLTLAIRHYVFTRSSLAHPWQQQAKLPSGNYGPQTQIVLSADGNTLAVSERATGSISVTGAVTESGRTAVHIYQRSSGTWTLQASFDASQTLPACPQPCSARMTARTIALSADGNLLAVTATGAVFTYARMGTSWAPQAYLPVASTDSLDGTSLALSGDGRTLAVSAGAFTNSTAKPAISPSLHVFAQGNDGVWSEQSRLLAGIEDSTDFLGYGTSAIALSSDGNTLAVHSKNSQGNQASVLDVGAGDLTCGGKVTTASGADWWYVALFGRDGNTWRRQAVMARGLDKWALASDGNALFYGGEQFIRRNGAWACP